MYIFARIISIVFMGFARYFYGSKKFSERLTTAIFLKLSLHQLWLVKIKYQWKEAQREVRQHWFIYGYISACIQALYMYCPGMLEYIR
jgi:hypothetical protein